jgi:hypothetical protein
MKTTLNLYSPTLQRTAHYYGDVVRAMLFAAGLLMLIGLPYFTQQGLIPLPVFGSIGLILIIGLIAGAINPLQPVVMIINVVVSLVSLLSFEFYAVQSYGDSQWLFFLVNQCLAILFFFTFYYGTKSLRGYLLSK